MNILTIPPRKNNMFLSLGKLISCSKVLHCKLLRSTNTSKLFEFSIKRQWQQNFLLSILKVLLHLTMNIILILCQTFLFRSYMHVISLLIYISSAILARI
jgi:hypothetical protein